MHICVVAPDWPTSKTIDFVFVEQLCRALALQGVTVSVIAPQSLTKCFIRHIPVSKFKSRIDLPGGKSYTLIRPKYFSAGAAGGFFENYSANAYRRAVKLGYKRVDGRPDVIYGHFWQSVEGVMPLAQKYDIPLIASSGEELVDKNRFANSEARISALRDAVCGTIHVSTNNRNECAATGLVKEDNSIVIPNAIDNKLFYPRDRKACREKLDISDEEFVVAYVGQFHPRKGILRLDDALKELNNPQIRALFIGKGPDVPTYPNMIHCGTVKHDDIPYYLSAADVFVLPTTNEGCCNAIIEAMACGLPVISSDLPFNYDVLNKNNSIMINPTSEEDIAKAIVFLKDNLQKRECMSKNALETAKSLTLPQRVERIIDFINNCIISNYNDNKQK